MKHVPLIAGLKTQETVKTLRDSDGNALISVETTTLYRLLLPENTPKPEYCKDDC